jgi:hypothetical protein
MIDRPGKFQDEPDYVPYFWDRAVKGLSGSIEDRVFTMTITEDDVKLYPELIAGQRLLLGESSDGFVYSKLISAHSKAVT